MFGRKKKLAELERRVERLEKKQNEFMMHTEVVCEDTGKEVLISMRFKEPQIYDKASLPECGFRMKR